MNDEKLSPIITEKLEELRAALRRFVTLNSLCWAVIWFLSIFWLGGLLDYLPVRIGASETPRSVRMGLLCILAFGLLWLALAYFLPRYFRKLTPRSLAVALERHFPSLGSSLVTAVELLEPKSLDQKLNEVSNPDAYRAMLSEAHQEAQTRVKPLEVREVINWQPIWLSGSIVTIGCLLSVAIFATQSDWTLMWASRLFGLSDARWPRSAELRADGVEFASPLFSGETASPKLQLKFDEDSTLRVPAGSDLLLQVAANIKAPKTPDVCTMYYRFADGTRGRANLRKIGSPVENWQPFTLDGPPLDSISESVRLDVVGLDGRISDLRIEVVEPAVTLQTQVQCQYPSYLASGDSGESLRAGTETLPYQNAMRIPEGSIISLNGEASSDLARVEYVVVSDNSSDAQQALSDSADQSGSPSTTAETPPEQSTPQVRSIRASGNKFAIPLGTMRQNMVVETRLIDQYGLPSGNITRYVLQVLPDTVPEVDTRFAGIGTAVTENALLPIKGTITDDHGVASVKVEISTGEGETTEIATPMQGETYSATLDLQQLRESETITLAVGQSIGIAVAAEDYYEIPTSNLPSPDDNSSPASDSSQSLTRQPHAGRSSPKQLSVVTLDELLILLDRQELEQRQRLDIIISELREVSELLIKLNVELATAVEAQSTSEAVDNLSLDRRIDIMAQQAVLQADKSQQELRGVALSIENVRQQLVNNRTGNFDRIDRLDAKVVKPLNSMLETQFSQFQESLTALRKEARQGAQVNADAISGRTTTAKSDLDEILAQLADIQANMLDMESFNEIVDMVRGLMDEQEELMNRTKEEQQRRVLDLFNN